MDKKKSYVTEDVVVTRTKCARSARTHRTSVRCNSEIFFFFIDRCTKIVRNYGPNDLPAQCSGRVG